MQLQPVETVNTISGPEFRQNYFQPGIPLVIRDLAKTWPAYEKWNRSYFRRVVGDQKVPVYNNVKSDPHTPVNRADAYLTFGKYIDLVDAGPAEWRIFLFNIFNRAPQLLQDFTWPDHLMDGFVKRAPMLFMGGQGSVTHMHFDIDLSHILHTQFEGKKRILLFPHSEQHKLYRKPFEVLSLADFSYYYDDRKSKLDYEKFPALKQACGYEVTLERGDTLFMPGGYWHHMEYIGSGFALSLRAIHHHWKKKLAGAWNLAGMRTIDTLMKKTAPRTWYDWKKKVVRSRAERFVLSEEEDFGFQPVFELPWGKKS